MNIKFRESLTEVFEYPSFESANAEDDDEADGKEARSTSNKKSGITSNKNPLGSFGKKLIYATIRVFF